MRKKMDDAQIDTMLQMHRYLMKCEIRHEFQRFYALNHNEDYSTANIQEAFNDKKWEEFAKWFKVIRDD